MADLKFLAGEWPAISRRLDEALALAPLQRDPWLQSLPETDSIKRTLRRLLEGEPRMETGDYLAAPPKLTLGPDDDAGQDAAACAGARVGPYRLLRQLGAGGMGVVWLAERIDGGLKRQVALKLPRLSWSSGLSERMNRERDILVSLDHPNIARIHDAGVDDHGRPYLALEFVEGEAIDGYCKRLGLSVPDRLRLVLQVARAVAHAHARLVVHRDLKPANILVTAEGQVRLLDFGIAKLLEGDLTCETQLTRQGGRALTPEYASPEQIRGEPLGTASDVYSLGVIAYELLAEAKPYQLRRASAAALEEAIESIDVRLASSAAASPGTRRALRGDLDAILNKALKKEIDERYPSVEAFAQDIERHLANLPVHARPDALGDRVRKFIRRNKLPVGAATAVGVSLLVGLTAALWQAREARNEAERAEQVKSFLLSIFDDADTDSGAGSATTAAELLKKAQQRVSTELVGRPEVAVELMTALAFSQIGQGMTADAGALMHDAVDLSARRLGPTHSLTAAAQSVYGEALIGLGRSKEAIAVLASCTESSRRSLELRTLVACLRWLSSAQLNEGQLDEAVDSAREAVAALSASHGRGKPVGPRDAMEAHASYANVLVNAVRPGAVAEARIALALDRDVYGQKTSLPVLEHRALLARALIAEGQMAEGLHELDSLVPAAIDLVGRKHPQVVMLANFVGMARLDVGDLPGAITALQQSLALQDDIEGSDAFGRGMVRFALASAFASAHRPALALPLLEQSVMLLRAGAGSDNPLTLRAASVHAWQLAEAGRLGDAEIEFRTLESARWVEPHLAAHRGRMALFRHLQGRHAEALELAESAANTFVTMAGKGVQARGHALLGTMRLDAGDARHALKPLQTAQTIYAQANVSPSPDSADALVALGRAQLDLADVSAASLSLAAADRFWQEYDPAHRHAGLAKLYLAQSLWAQGDKHAAVEALRQSAAPLTKSAFPADRTLLDATRQRFAASGKPVGG
jgi:eukaryotic-like serine/threonine-protein kinase